MEYRRLGGSGLKLSALSYGSWVTFSFQMDDEAAARCMSIAYDAGVNFFDNSEAYAAGESERIMGRVLEKLGMHVYGETDDALHWRLDRESGEL